MSAPTRSLERLSGAFVADTVDLLGRRIAARFPGRGLTRVADELARLVRDVEEGTAQVRTRLHWVRVACRIGVAVVVLATVTALFLALRDVGRIDSSVDWLPLIESAINDVVFAAIAVFFLLALPNRIERRHLLDLLHRLRSLAHIVDMHQLTKDPERLRPDFTETAVSPEIDLDRAGMEHYLNYCSELLSLIGKACALCAEESQDPVVLETVARIETLTTAMARKIWQKINVLPPA